MQHQMEMNCPPIDQLPSVDIVIVCFDSETALDDTLTFMHQTRVDWSVIRLIVVNNSQHDTQRISQICEKQGARFVQMATNAGFSAAVNFGASLGTGSYLLLLSPGNLITADAIDSLRRTAKQRPDVVGLGLVNEGVSGRLSYKTKSVVDFGRKRKIVIPIKSNLNETIPTSFISGGGFMIKRTAFEKISGFDEQIFLFHEDDDFSARLSELGELVYVLNAKCLHRRNENARSDTDLRIVRGWHLGHSKFYVLKKHHGRLGIAIALLSSLAFAASPIYLLSKSRRVKTNAFIAGTLAGLRGMPATKGLLPRRTRLSEKTQPGA